MTRVALTECALYLGDNGRAFCGSMKCAGATAYFSGCDLSGQRVERLTAREAVHHNIICEGCGYQPTLVILR